MVVSLLREAMDEAQIPRGRALAPAGTSPQARPPVVAIVGLGDDDLPTALALQRAGMEVIAVDASNEAQLAEADAVLVCVPTPVDEHGNRDLRALHRACAAVCRHARRGQTIVLTALAYAGATCDLLAAPLAAAGFQLGTDICVACSPALRPRVLGAAGELCAQRALTVVGALAPNVHVLASPEAAESLALELAELSEERR